MSWKVMRLVTDALASGFLVIGPVAAGVLKALADRAHDDGTKIYPSIAWISWQAQARERAVRYALRLLEAPELRILVRDRDGYGRGNSSLWHLDLDVLANCARAKKGAPDASFSERTPTEKGRMASLKGARGVKKRGALRPLTDHRTDHEPTHAGEAPADAPPALVCVSPLGQEKNPESELDPGAIAESKKPPARLAPRQVNRGIADEAGTVLRPAARRRRNKVKAPARIPLLADFALTGERRQVPLAAGIIDADACFARFANYYRSEGKLAADWDAKWKNWCTSKHQDDLREPPNGAGSGPAPDTGKAIEKHKQWELDLKAEREARQQKLEGSS